VDLGGGMLAVGQRPTVESSWRSSTVERRSRLERAARLRRGDFPIPLRPRFGDEGWWIPAAKRGASTESFIADRPAVARGRALSPSGDGAWGNPICVCSYGDVPGPKTWEAQIGHGVAATQRRCTSGKGPASGSGSAAGSTGRAWDAGHLMFKRPVDGRGGGFWRRRRSFTLRWMVGSGVRAGRQ